MSYQKIRVGRDEAITTITLADPATMNAASLDLVMELLDAFKDAVLGATPARAIILTGEGRGFCSGANLQAGPGGGKLDGDGKPDAGAALETIYNPLVTYVKEMTVPFITAVNGAAAGRGVFARASWRSDRRGRVRLLSAGIPSYRPRSRRRVDLPAAAHDRSGPSHGNGAPRRTCLR